MYCVDEFQPPSFCIEIYTTSLSSEIDQAIAILLHY